MVSQNQLGVSVMRFIDIEKRELLADKLRSLLKVGTKVSPDEVKTDFEQKGTQVQLQYVRFSPKRFEEGTEPSAADVDAYIKSHAEDLKKLYDERAFQYKKVEKQAKLRHISVEVGRDAPKEKVDAAKKVIDDAAAKLKAVKPFADIARSLSNDEFTKKRGGLQGYRKKGFTGYPPAIDDKIFAAKKGDVIGPERTDRGFELILVEDFREGDVPLEVAEREIAEEKIAAERAKAKAKSEADALVAKVKGGAKLEDLVPKDEDKPDPKMDPQLAALMKRLSETPKLNETELFPRKGNVIPELGISPELSKKAFEMKIGEVAGPFDVTGSFVVVKLKDRKDPDLADFEKRKNDIVREYERSKWAEVLDGWSKQRCTEARDQGRLRVNDDVLFYEAQQPMPGPKSEKPKYEPCVGTRMF
jgi:peptidyl-prolyl cis-trans isomerase D